MQASSSETLPHLPKTILVIDVQPPYQQHWITMQDDLQLFTNASTRIATFALPPGMQAGDFQSIIWRPDSSGIFLVSTSSQLYALDVSTGEIELVEQHLATAGPAGLIWVH